MSPFAAAATAELVVALFIFAGAVVIDQSPALWAVIAGFTQ